MTSSVTFSLYDGSFGQHFKNGPEHDATPFFRRLINGSLIFARRIFWCKIQAMKPRHRHSPQPYPLKGVDSSIQLPTLSGSVHDGSKIKPHRFRYGATVSLSQAILLAAASASLATVLTAFGASHYLMNRFDSNSNSFMTTMSHATFPHIVRDASESIMTTQKLGFLSTFGMVSNSAGDKNASIFEDRIQEPAFLRDCDEGGEVDDGQPKPVWLMSYPNRYVSYISKSCAGIFCITLIILVFLCILLSAVRLLPFT